MNFIVTHQNLDLDAITGVWLLQRFVPSLDRARIVFVNTGNPDQETLNQAAAVVDTGRVWDESELRFDHHQLPGRLSNDTCAAKQVFNYAQRINSFINSLEAGGQGLDLEYLQPLIDLVFCGDTGRREADSSRELGLHAIYSGWRAWFAEQNPGERLPDEMALSYGYGLLDVLEVRLRKQAEAKAELDSKTVYKSEDGLVWAIQHGSMATSQAAFDQGARLVVFEGEPVEVEGGTTYPVGIQRAAEWQEPHCGQLVDKILEFVEYELASDTAGDFSIEALIKAELPRWYKHNSGFFAGRGTPKAPVFEPVEVGIAYLAGLINTAWKR